MKQALIFLEEIKMYERIYKTTNKAQLRKDFKKKYDESLAELKYYCKCKNINFNELVK